MVAIAAILPHPVSLVQKNLPPLVCAGTYIAEMPAPDTKQILWENVSSLMLHHFGKENLSELSRKAKVGLATCDRIKKQETSVGTDTLEKIAEVFHLQAWHLLTPRLDPTNPPVIWLTQTEHDLYEKLRNLAATLAKIQH
jgi:hypothetical protein